MAVGLDPWYDIAAAPYNADRTGMYDISTAVANAKADIAAATTGGWLFFPPGRYKVSTNLLIDVDVIMAAGAILAPDSGTTVTISGSIQAGAYQIFDADVADRFVTFAAAASSHCRQLLALPQWWGARVDNATDDTVALNAAINALGNQGGGTLSFAGRLRCQGDIDLKDGVNIWGFGTLATFFNQFPGGAPLRLRFGSEAFSVHRGGKSGNFTVDGTGGSTVSDTPLVLGQCSNRSFDSIRVIGAGQTGVTLLNVQNSTLNNIDSTGNPHGVDLDAGCKNIDLVGLVIGSATGDPAQGGGYGLRLLAQTPVPDAMVGYKTNNHIKVFGGVIEMTNNTPVYIESALDVELVGLNVNQSSDYPTIRIKQVRDPANKVSGAFQPASVAVVAGDYGSGSYLVEAVDNAASLGYGATQVFVDGNCRVAADVALFHVDDLPRLTASGTYSFRSGSSVRVCARRARRPTPTPSPRRSARCAPARRGSPAPRLVHGASRAHLRRRPGPWTSRWT